MRESQNIYSVLNETQIKLKECEIRLTHTSDLYNREKIEKDAVNRILNQITGSGNQ
jgi:hypothetical protein